MEDILSNNSENSEEKIDIKAYFVRLLTYWWIFPISIFLCLATAFLYLRYTTPIYQISAKILVEDEKKGGGNLSAGDILGEMGGFLNAKSNVDNEVEILKTYSLAEKVVQELHLNIAYFSQGTFKDNQLYKPPFVVELLGATDSLRPTLFQFFPLNTSSFSITYKDLAGDEVKKEMQYDRPFLIKEIGVIKIKRNYALPFKEKGYKFHVTSVQVAAAGLQKQLKVSVTNKFVTTIDIKLEHGIPKLGEEILSSLINAYVTQNIAEKNKIVESTIDFIDNRLLFVSRELGDIEGNIQSFKQENELADISEQSKLLVGNTSVYAKQAADLETQLSIIEALEDYLKDESKNKRVMPSAVLPQDISFATLVENYNVLLSERDRLLLASTEENPYVKNLDDRIAGVRSSMLSNLHSIKKSTQISLDQLQKKINLLESEIRKVPAHERTYLGMYRQQTLKQELYLFLLKKREETALTKTSNVANSKMIDAPRSESRPVSPKKQIILLIGLIVGSLIPIVIISILDFFNNLVESKEELQKTVQAPLIGEISLTDINENSVHLNTRTLLAEQFRTLRTNLNFFVQNEKGMCIVLTSSMPGEGKTFISINLATILALSGKKVLLMDFDLRVAGLTERLNFKNKIGLTNLIVSSELTSSNVTYPSSIHENLSIIPSGILPPNPAETIMSERTEKLMEEIRKEYDYVILDAPPVGMVSDVQLINKYASVTLYVVRLGHTLKEKLSIPRDLYRHNRMNKMGIVLNGTKVSLNGGYGYVYGEDPKNRKKKKTTA